MEKLKQSDRFARLSTPLGQDVLVLTRFDGYESISDNFEWSVQALLNIGEQPVDASRIIGQPCHVVMDGLAGDARYFHGLCTEIRFMGWQGKYMHYHLVLRPWTWLLTRETENEIFHDMKVDDIIKKVFNDRGFSDFRFKTTKSYSPIHFCVQYQETTYAFVSRLMEKYGLFAFFLCTDSKHELVIIDDQNSAEDISAYAPIDFYPETASGSWEPRIVEWQAENRLRTGKVDVDDYNYDKPNTALEKSGNAKDAPSHSHGKLTQYKYPTGHYDPGDGQLLADVFVDVERADAQRKFASGFAPLIHAGGTFKLGLHPADEENVKHMTVGARHTAVQSYSEAGISNQNDEYFGSYESVDASLAYKAPLETPWPKIYGSQTALVIKSKNAPSDEEIDVDDQGRILILFHWNNHSQNPDQCSCRVRVAQLWAGSGWGGVWIPRVGMEVVVEFIEGDPNRPLVTGCVYNGNNKPPISFPADKTQSTIKSQSSKGGTSADHFNELRFEDKKDDEEIYIHAERDRYMEIEHDDDIIIGNNQTEKIGGSRDFELTGGDETVILKGAPGTKDKYGKMITKGGHRTTTLELGDETLTIAEGKRTTSIKMDDKRTITDGDDLEIIEKGKQQTDIKKGNQITNIDMGNQTTTIKMGNQKTSIKAGKGEVDAMQKYEIKVGGSKITMDPMSITLKAMTITIDASMNLTAKGGIGATLQGGASCTVKGGIVMIN
ncbi:MAG: type VI secretion system tip protein TssI/VgrG [Pseudomonadota bacterium]